MRKGLELPPVALPSSHGGTVDPGRLAGRALLILYPWTGRPGTPNPLDWDDIPGAHGSTPELEGFRDLHARFADIGISLFAVSRQDTAWQQELAERLGLPFPILSDADDRLWPKLEAETFETGGEIYLKRTTLLISDGHVEEAFADISDPGGHAAELLTRLAG
ncbi:MAG: redoxin domain-containing protein [Methyloligella sp. ZOD6]